MTNVKTEIPSPRTHHDAIAANIRAARARLHIEQADLAALMATHGYTWHRNTVSNIERGERRVLAEELSTLSRVLEVAVSELLELPRPRVGVR